MFIKVFLSWFRACMLGIGCSLIAAGLVGYVTPEVAPFPIVFTLVVGFSLAVLSLVMTICTLIPTGPSGE